MVIKTVKTLLFYLTTQVLLSTGCSKSKCENDLPVYSFKVTAEWAPQKETYNVGDTIFLISRFPKVLSDQINPSIVVNYSNAKQIDGGIGFGYLDSANQRSIPSIDSFTLAEVEGSYINIASSQKNRINIAYSENTDHYSFYGAVVCRKPGIYSLGIVDLFCQGVSTTNDCSGAVFDITVTNTDKHLYLHQNALGVDPNNPVLQKYSYDFRVR
jgi:hypothetical protein